VILISDKSRSRTFWSGNPIGSLAAQVAAKQDQEALQCKMARTRIARKYAELRARSIC
jgi:hypothetical protein